MLFWVDVLRPFADDASELLPRSADNTDCSARSCGLGHGAIQLVQWEVWGSKAQETNLGSQFSVIIARM